jgi:dTDP-4-dehydrorhamnose reductase
MNGKAKILITGSKGMLGSSFVDCLNIGVIKSYSSDDLDVTNYEKFVNLMEFDKPDIIIHTAAYTDVEGCEINKDKAYLVNTMGTQNVVNYCIGKEVLLIYISSTGVYGSLNRIEQYNEFDDINPTTIHHKSKYEAEKLIEKHLSRFLIIRTGWLFGGDKNHNKNFVYKRYLEAKDQNVIYSDNSQIGNPTYIVDLVDQIKLLIKYRQYGTFNCVNKANNISRFDYVKKIIELFNINSNVEVAPHNMFNRISPVSKNESAINYKLDILGLNIMGDWEGSLTKYIKKLKNSI